MHTDEQVKLFIGAKLDLPEMVERGVMCSSHMSAMSEKGQVVKLEVSTNSVYFWHTLEWNHCSKQKRKMAATINLCI